MREIDRQTEKDIKKSETQGRHYTLEHSQGPPVLYVKPFSFIKLKRKKGR